MEFLKVLFYNKDYLKNTIYLNGTIGPIAGRVKKGVVETKDSNYQLTLNSGGKDTLHSGDLALTFKVFDFDIEESANNTKIRFFYNEKSIVDYNLTVEYLVYDDRIVINYDLVSFDDFIFSLTNHAYFNLSGNLNSNILSHQVQLSSNKRHLLGEDLLITNQISETDLYDFQSLRAVESTITLLSKTPKGGVDDIFFFPFNKVDKPMAKVFEPNSKRLLEVYSTYDHMVFYSHNNINESKLRFLEKHERHFALCFECQKSPYGFNNKDASTSYLQKNRRYFESIIYKFSVLE